MQSEKIKTITIIILIFIVIGTITYTLIIPEHDQKIFTSGYNQAQIDLASNKALPLIINQYNETSNRTNSEIIVLGICSQEFIDNYNKICGIQ